MVKDGRTRVPLKGGLNSGETLRELRVVRTETVIATQEITPSENPNVINVNSRRVGSSEGAKPQRRHRVTKFEEAKNRLFTQLLLAEGKGFCGVSDHLKEALHKAETPRERYDALRAVIVAASSQLGIEHPGLSKQLDGDEVSDDKIQRLINQNLCPAADKVITAIEVRTAMAEKIPPGGRAAEGGAPIQQQPPIAAGNREQREEQSADNELVEKIIQQQARLSRYYERNSAAKTERSVLERVYTREELTSWKENSLTTYSQRLQNEISSVCPRPPSRDIEEFLELKERYPEHVSENRRDATPKSLMGLARHELAPELDRLRAHDRAAQQEARREYAAPREERRETAGGDRRERVGEVVRRRAIPTEPANVVRQATHRAGNSPQTEEPHMAEMVQVPKDEIDRLRGVEQEYTKLTSDLESARALVETKKDGESSIPFNKLLLQLHQERTDAQSRADSSAQQRQGFLDEFQSVIGKDYSPETLRRLKKHSAVAVTYKEERDDLTAQLKAVRSKRSGWRNAFFVATILSVLAIGYIISIWVTAFRTGYVQF